MSDFVYYAIFGLSDYNSINKATMALRELEATFLNNKDYNNYVQIKAARSCLMHDYGELNFGNKRIINCLFGINTFKNSSMVNDMILLLIEKEFSKRSISLEKFNYDSFNERHSFLNGFIEAFNRKIQTHYNSSKLLSELFLNFSYYDEYQYQLCDNLISLMDDFNKYNCSIEFQKHICVWLYNSIPKLRN